MKKSFKDLISSVTKSKKNEEVVVTIESKNQNTNCPKVKINDIELAVTLGQWMGALPDSVKSGGNGMFIISHLEASELLKRTGVTQSQLDGVADRFANILRMAGFGAGNDCILSSFDGEQLNFNCEFQNTGDSAEMHISFGSWMDEGPEFVVDYDGIKCVYNYWHSSKEQIDRLDLQSLSKKVDKDGTKGFYHFVSEFHYWGNVHDNENRVELSIDYPQSIKDEEKENPYVNEAMLEEILSAVTFPADIEAICSRIAQALKKDVKDYPQVTIIVKKLKEGKEEKTTDRAVFKNGEFDEFMITKDGKTITVNNFNAWSYDSERYAVSQEVSSQVNFGFKGMPVEELETMPTPTDMIKLANTEAENVRTLAKTMFHKK